MMKTLRSIVNIALIEWRNVFYSTKLCMLGLIFIFINIQIVTPLKECSILMNDKISYFEPFVAICNSGIVLLVLPLFYLAIISDFPQNDGIAYFVHIRCTSLQWVAGEILFLVLSAVTMVGFVLLSGVLLVGKRGRFSFQYSDAVTKYVASYPEKAGDYVTQLLPENLYNQISLRDTILNSLVLIILYFLLIGSIIFFFALIHQKYIGFLVDGILIFAGVVTSELHMQSMWYFPLAHTVQWLHYTEYISVPIVSMRSSYTYFGIILTIFIIGCVAIRKRY